MLKDRSDQYREELRDPVLSALLHEAFENEADELTSPGRSERIMRKVLASGVYSAPRRSRWSPWVWATGSLATTAAAVVILLGTLHSPLLQQGQNVDTAAPKVAEQTMPAAVPLKESSTPRHMAVTYVKEKPAESWTETTQPRQKVSHQNQILPRKNAGIAQGISIPHDGEIAKVPTVKPNAETPAASTHQVAAALYNAGSAAHAVGDYATAYSAYQASYELEPTPDALLASGTALEHIANDELSADGSSS
ncbi:MAG TPA: hypothetical protein VHV83_00790 [Armatimonadota bacterium]|nr:hypothetical protein [Armatimonadota bacterium]